MPSPTLLEWCNTSINSMQQSMHQIFSCFVKPDLQVPPQILEIQRLNGQKPGDKLKSLNMIVNTIVDNVKNGNELDNQLSSITPISLSNLIKTNAGVKLQLWNVIVESLKSEDASISKKALSAQWFFDGGNPNVSAEYFMKDILPFVSVRTRLDIVNRLGRGLQGYENKAQDFFVKLVDLYGVHESLPILTACSEKVILDSILQYKIVLPMKNLRALYSKYPELIISYLHLGNSKNMENSSSRKVHEINIHDYDTFLPELIRRHPQDFVALYELTPEKNLAILSCHRSSLLLRKVKEVIISKSHIFIKLLHPKIVKSKLTTEEIETMMENYLPKDINDFSLDGAIKFIDNYLSSDKIQVLLSKFEKIYNQNLLEYARKIIIESDTKATNSGWKLLQKLSATERENQVRILLRSVDEGSALRNLLTRYLNTAESLSYFKDKIAKSSSADERMQFFGMMIVSCGMQNNKKDLLSVLQYYQEKHKNERNLFQLFEYLKREFDLKALEDGHWSALRHIIRNAHMKKQLFVSHATLIEEILEAMLRHAITCKRKNDRYIEEAIEMIVECKVENFSSNWNVLKENLTLEKECLEKFFLLIPVKYPENHRIWKKENNRLVLALSLLKSIRNYNNQSTNKNPTEQINLKDYPWIMKLTEEFICRSTETGFRKEFLIKLVKQQAPEFYEAKMNESSLVRDIGTGEALRLLKQQPEVVLAHWLDYLNEVRDILGGQNKRTYLEKTRKKLPARRFVAATKWHHELPVKFIEVCLAEKKINNGSLAVLGILLPGEIFEKVAAAFVPKGAANMQAIDENTKESFEITQAVLQAAKWTNPPVSLESLWPFCRTDHVTIADGTLASLARRVSIGSAAEFAKKLASQPQASLMKRGIHMAKCVTTDRKFQDFLIQTWPSSKNISIKRYHTRVIFDAFVKSPNSKNWDLMVSCLRDLTVDDKETLVQNLSKIDKVSTKFLSKYIEEYLKKVEEIFGTSLEFQWRTKCVCLIVESFDEKLTNNVSEEVILKILKKYFFDIDCLQISLATRTFAIRYYLLTSNPEKFGLRLNVLINILKKTIENFDDSHPKKRRFYPANYTVQEFFGCLLNELCYSDSQKKLQIVESVLDVFKMSLSPWQEPSSYLALNLYKEYIQSTSPEDFGMRTAKRISTLLEDFLSDEPIADIADCLNKFIANKIFCDHKNPFTLKLAIIEGLLQGDEHYGGLTSIKLLDEHEIMEYDERYDRLITTLRQRKNTSIQYNLYRHINNLTEQ